jgi:MFS family permease
LKGATRLADRADTASKVGSGGALAVSLPAQGSAQQPGGSVAAPVALSFIAMAAFLILPQLMQAVVDDMRYTERAVGVLSSLVMAGSTASAVAAAYWVRRVAWRGAAYLALLGLVATEAGSMLWHAPAPFLALQCAAGFCGGSLYSLALTVLSDGRNPDRDFGYSVAAQVAFQVAGLLAGPSLLALGGVNALLGLFALLGLLGTLLVRSLPAHGRPPPASHGATRLLTLPTALALAGCFLFFFNVGCYWTYVELIGSAAGLGLRELANGLAVGVSFGIPGALLAAWLGERYGRLAPIALCALVTVVAALLLAGKVALPGFIASTVLYNLAWNLSLTYQYSTVNAVDRSGRGVAAAPAFHSGGAAAGPAVAAFLVSPADHGSVVWLVTASVLASLGCFAAASRLQRARRAGPSMTAAQSQP